jgi:hypothetical protein
VVRGVPAQPLLQAAAAHHLDAGLAIKNPPKNPLKMFFLGFFLNFKFFIKITFLFETDFLRTNKT